MRWGFHTLGGAGMYALLAGTAAAQIASAQEIIVIAPGGQRGGDATNMLDARDIRIDGSPDLIPALARTLPGVSLQEAQANPFQPNLVYHGYTASPLQGNAQGLAVYLDGARFNQPFGETVQFDLLPDAAIETIGIADASPVYGLNALGGALIVATRTGRTAPGVTITAGGGDHGRGEGALEAGWSNGPRSAFIALQARHDGGWRRHSPSTLYNAFVDLGFDGAAAGAHLKLIGADSDLTGNGSSPVELLAADRRAVFTYPDNTRNRYGRASLHPWVAVSAATRLEASLYVQHLRQRTVNGDSADVSACDDPPGLLCLENDDDEQVPLIDTTGRQVPALLATRGREDDGAYGVLNRSRTSTTAGGLLVQVADKRPLFGGTNRLVAGGSYDRSRTGFHATSELGVLADDRRVDGLGPVIAQPDGAITPVSLIARTAYTGLFASDTLPLGLSVSAELGLRYNIATIALKDRIGEDLNGHHRFTRLNPGAALVFRPSSRRSFRAGYAETNRAPTPAELSCAGPDDPCSFTNFFVGDPPLKQVVAKSWTTSASGSGGAIKEWTLHWRASAYRAINHDDIQFIASDVRGRAFFQNIGRTRRQGLDAQVDAAHGPWTARIGYAFTDATFRTPVTLTSADNPSADDDGEIRVARGDRLPGVPRQRGIVSLDYVGRLFSFGGDVQAQSGQVLFGDEGNDQPRTKAFATVGLRAGLRLFGPIWAFGEVTNLLDRHYATFGTFSETGEVFLTEAPGATDPRSLSPGAPRRCRAGLRATF